MQSKCWQHNTYTPSFLYTCFTTDTEKVAFNLSSTKTRFIQQVMYILTIYVYMYACVCVCVCVYMEAIYQISTIPLIINLHSVLYHTVFTDRIKYY